MKEIEKPITLAEKFIKEHRTHFASLYPSDMHLWLWVLGSSETKWNDKGELVSYPTTNPVQLTEDGWKSAIHNAEVPLFWDKDSARSPLLEIPDHAEASFLYEISHFCYSVEKIDPELFRKYLEAYNEMKGYRPDYTASEIKRNFDGFLATQEIVKAIEARIRFIEAERREKALPKPQPQLRVGATVRLKTGVEFAEVVEMFKVKGEPYNTTVVRVSPALGGETNFDCNFLKVTA